MIDTGPTRGPRATRVLGIWRIPVLALVLAGAPRFPPALRAATSPTAILGTWEWKGERFSGRFVITDVDEAGLFVGRFQHDKPPLRGDLRGRVRGDRLEFLREGRVLVVPFSEIWMGDLVRDERGLALSGQWRYEVPLPLQDGKAMHPWSARWVGAFIGPDEGEEDDD